MRRSLLCLTVMFLAAGIAFRIGTSSTPQEQVAAQEQVADASDAIRNESRDQFAVPDATEAEVLVEFVKVLKRMRPAEGQARDEYDAKAPAAIRRACERILKLDNDSHSEPRRFARRELSELHMHVSEKSTPYPMFNVREVLDELIASGAKLHKAGRTKTDAELRKGLTREVFETELLAPMDQEISDRDLYRRTCESVFIVCSLYKVKDADDWETSLATAFAVTTDGVLSTSCHVFDNEDDADAVVVMDVHQQVYPVRELLAANRHADTCLFRIDAPKVNPLPLAEDAAPGTRIRVLGHPGDSFYFFSNGTLANYERDSDGATWLNITADFGQGSSGGPVMDECGNVVGQVSRTFTLYAGGPATRRRLHRVQGEKAANDSQESEGKTKTSDDIADPQMVFKSCVPAKTLRSLVKTKKSENSR